MIQEKTLSDFIEYIIVRRIAVPDSKELVVSVPKLKHHLKKLREDLKKSITESADKTDIWDNERWDDFRNMLRKEINKIFKENIGDGILK